jgi:hypothetical protein
MSKHRDQIPPKIFFSKSGNSYWLELANGGYLPLDKASVGLHLRRAGLSKENFINGLNELENAIVMAQLERAVDYAGPLGGRRQGLFVTSAGERILVTSEARADVFHPIALVEKPRFDFIANYLDQLFGDEQQNYALAWLKVARQSLLRGEFRPGQLLVLVGQSGCGKSLFHAFITEVLGGRSGKPYRYMIGETPFNADWVGAEHLIIEDETWSTDIRARWKFNQAIKEITVADEMSVHPKNRPAIKLPVWHRSSMSINNQPEHLQNLPLRTSDIQDKMMLLKCSPADLPDDRKLIWGNILKEMPAFLSWLNRWQIPKSLKPTGADIRYGVAGYSHPEIVEQLTHVSPEQRLEDLLDEVFEFKTGPEHMTAGEVEQALRRSEFAHAVPHLFYYTGACATILGRLATLKKERFEAKPKDGKKAWIIHAPSQEAA